MSRKNILTILLLATASVLLTLIFQNFANQSGENAGPAHQSLPEPDKVICMSPAVTEIAFALGQADRIVGVSEYVTYPPEAMEKPQCGGYINPNFERILNLQPDLILTQGTARKMEEFCRKNNIRLQSLRLSSLDSIFQAIRKSGQLFHCRKEARDLLNQMKSELEAIREKANNRNVLSVALIIGREPGTLRNITAAGPNSYINDVITLAGGKNVFSDLRRNYGSVSKETIISRNPDVIIELHGKGMIGEQKRERILNLWAEAMPSLNAVQNKQIYTIGSPWAMIPGPRITRLAIHLDKIFSGETP